MNHGDILLLYTDGVVEATDEKGDFYGEERLTRMLIDHRDEKPKEISQNIIEDVQKFNISGTQSDDKTIVTIKRS
jgi:sigma-B regulation protein RsbU (phosphoserine phosphatase)